MHGMRIRAARRVAFWAGMSAIVALATTPARAQDRPAGHDPEEHLAKLQEELDLDDQQVERIRAIFAEQHGKLEQLHAEKGGDRESDREAFRQLRQETHERIQAVLNEDQRARLEGLHAEHRERHGHGPGHRGPGGHGAKERPDTG